jgi:formylglycine-generating enzyme required for sulfatase activity
VPGAAFALGRGECHVDDVACGTERACVNGDGSDYSCLASETPAVTASVRAFFLDRFEVTVGRFRKFVEAVDTGWRPASGDGKHGYLNGGTESGWEGGWTIPMTASAWDAALSCSPTWQTWTPRIGANETKPINCVSWYDAYAFCIWDGGVLPSEAEWELAASGGEERVFPWGNDDPGTTRACYVPSCSGLASAVGAFPTGDGRWGHADLAGNVFEWVLDFAADYPSGSCNDCAFLSSGSHRRLRGGHFRLEASFLRAAYRSGLQPWSAGRYVGVRCARTVE